jgi:hypothetical protein
VNLTFDLTPAQSEFIQDTTTPNLLMCGGYGSGKSRAGALKAVLLALANPGTDGIVASPTLGLAKRTIVKQLQEVLDTIGVKYKYNKSELIFRLEHNRPSEIHVLSAENWVRLVGMNASFFVFDEIDTMKTDDAREAWGKLKSRLRVGQVRQACACTTPEGFKFAYEYFKLETEERPELLKDRKIIRARTYDSPFVDDTYIKSLQESYTPQLIKAYLEGEFVNLLSGQVYINYDRELNGTDLTIDDLPEHRPLMVGIDFNYRGMSAIVMGQFGEPKRDIYGRPVNLDEGVTAIVDEVIGSRNTPDLIEALKERYPKRNLIICPDTSGNQNKSSASMTDIALLKAAGFDDIRHQNQNPRVKDRVNSVNARFLNGRGARRLLVNDQKAPLLARCLEHQTYGSDGMPIKGTPISDKTETTQDGPLDALGYANWMFWPLVPRATARVS